ncbi:MAG: hypothetical protein J07HB67_00529 [halophilic archaeon J07HB67]|nr:MAG: hypothetical protein J07HB67_00529 [halophilic archaeon J07HB67]
MAAVVVDAAEDRLDDDEPARSEEVGGECRQRLHAHVFAAAGLVEPNLRLQRLDQILCRRDAAGDRERRGRVDLLDLLDVLRGDHRPQRGAHVRRQDDTVLGLQPDGRRSGLHLTLGTAGVPVGVEPTDLRAEHGLVVEIRRQIAAVVCWSHCHSVGGRRG